MNELPAANSAPPGQRTITLSFTEGQADDIMADLPLGHSVSEATRDLYVRLREALKQPAQEEPMSYIPENHDDGVIHAPPQPVRPIPERQPSRGTALRKVDITGISGLGHIVEFCVFSDGATAIRWLGGPPRNQPKFEFYDNPGIAPFQQISGHNGNTEIVWIDDEPPAPQQ
jgi:hypothetical protein